MVDTVLGSIAMENSGGYGWFMIDDYGYIRSGLFLSTDDHSG